MKGAGSTAKFAIGDDEGGGETVLGGGAGVVKIEGAALDAGTEVFIDRGAGASPSREETSLKTRN